MGNGQQQGQRRSRHDPTNARVVDMAATTPAMQALIDASMSASEAQTAEDPSMLGTVRESPSTLESPTRIVHRNSAMRGDATHGVISPMNESGLANLDPNDHARVSDPILRPAKKKNRHRNKVGKRGRDKNNTDDTDDDSDNSDRNNAGNETHKTPIGFSDSILSRLYEPDRIQKPQLWEFIRLVAPGPANQPPKGQYKWRSKDAVAAYCLKCKVAFTYTPGTSKTVSRHLVAHHGYSSSGTVPPSPKAGSPSKSNKPKSNEKDPGESSRNTTNNKSSQKTPISFLKRGQRRGLNVSSSDGKRSRDSTTNLEADAEEIPNNSLERNDETIAPMNLPTPSKKRKASYTVPEQPSNKKGREDSNFSKSWGEPEESQQGVVRRDREVMDLLTTDDEDGEDEFIKGRGRSRKDLMEKALFRWWIGSYQSLDFYNISGSGGASRGIFGGRNKSMSLFVDFCKTLDNSFELPEPFVIDSMVKASYERLQTEIKIHVSKLFPSDVGRNNKSYEFVSASVRRVKVVRIVDSRVKGLSRDCDASFAEVTGKGGMQLLGNEKTLEIEEKIFYPVRVTFCTPMFRMKSYVIAVIPGENENENRNESQDKNDDTMTSPYSKAVDNALRMYGFPRENVSHIVIHGADEKVKGVGTSKVSNVNICILERLDGILVKTLRHLTILPKWIQLLLYQEGLPGEEEIGKVVQKSTSSSIYFTIRAYDKLLESLPEAGTAETLQHNLIAEIVNTITPFRDAIQALSEDPYSAVGLSIPIVRRVNALLQKRAKWLEESQANSAEFPEDIDVDEKTELREILKSFHGSMQEIFEKIFAQILEDNPSLMWTVPLDPRLIGMRGLSGTEKTEAKTLLIKEVANIVQLTDRRKSDRKHYSKNNRFSSASTMGGIFWGDDDEDPATSNAADLIGISSDVTDSEQYAKKNVESYFNAVHSQRQIKDPLLWWKNNQDQFPELAMLARKWMSASAIYGRKHTRENESMSVILTSHSDTESICRMIFLHDNNDLV